MAGLWADGWFYISSAGLLISGVLFFFLLGQYRAACEAADAGEIEQAEAHVVPAIRPVWVHDDEPAHAPVASVSAEKAPDVKPVEIKPPEPKPAEVKQVEKDSSVATGGISPAVVYLQNIKGQLAELHEEVRTLAKRVDSELGAVSTRDEALIARLGELTQAVEAMRALAPVSAPAPAPEPKMTIELGARPMSEPTPKPAPEPKPKPESKPAPTLSPDETMRMQLGAVIDAQLAPKDQPSPTPAAQPAAAAADPVVLEAPVEEKPRRGPVWPV